MLAHQLELLAPARDADIGIAALNHGADAVYIGGPSFGARSSADNSVSEIARLVQHARRFHSRIFVTLNTILRDDELEPARKLVGQLYDAGVDALIIQDMGLLELELPPIQLHASTQTDIRTPEKARFLQDVGLSQIVLARELTLQQIREIRRHTECTLEFFVHGALCVAYSGQCYISHAHTGRSANRGDCSQACRLPYQVTDAQGRFVAHDKHVLSMKDNNQSANIAALVEAGIRSFKIEGRYKDLAYVKNITAHYRVLLDELLEQRPELARASSGRTTFSFTPDPNQNFNREFTDYFVQGRQQDIGAFDTPKNPGQAIGFVTRVYKGVKENGAIFSHPNPWAIIAACKLGDGDLAMKFYDAINPARQNDKIEIREAEPYSYVQFIYGQDHTLHGKAMHPWLTGTASWMYNAATRWILGVRLSFKGLVIDPCIPADWKGFTVQRRWRGAMFFIKVSNPDGVQKGVRSIMLNGKLVEGAIPQQPAGSMNAVEVVMGEVKDGHVVYASEADKNKK